MPQPGVGDVVSVPFGVRVLNATNVTIALTKLNRTSSQATTVVLKEGDIFDFDPGLSPIYNIEVTVDWDPKLNDSASAASSSGSPSGPSG